ncbi:MAG: type II restriction endonuclease [Chitinophagales bacterium]|nr:type II restriction endonuclease [Chitinophagales bacterium]
MSKSFEIFIKQLSTTNSTLDFFVDYTKIQENIDNIAIKLNQLNYLIGQDDLNSAVKKLFNENKNCFSVLNILIAVRNNRPILNDKGEVVLLYNYFDTDKSIIEFLEKTGLAHIFRTKQIKNLVDYVFGIEVGLDTNARKNRVGKNMEKTIAKIFTQNEIKFEEQVRLKLNSLGEDVKQFDFTIKTKSKTYLIETNYYNGGGSKLNEVARAYTDLAPKINQYKNYEFVWITDGVGWHSAKNKLEEAFNNIPLVYNLYTIKNFIQKIKNESQ